MRRLLLLVPLILLAAPGRAEVVKATPAGFEITEAVTIDAPIAQAWATLRSPQKWWDKEHTYSGDSANLYLDAQATGCFCERLKDKGSIEHAHIVYIQPPQMMRLVGALGPLQAEAVTGTLTFTLAPEGSNATRVTLSYIVGGYVRNLKAAAEAPPAAEGEAK